ncbi:hypothetical protein Pcinc_022521 [Petrolisthes cinctipes]|uniref:Thyroglobulin type-1 domain-containing protein n=1 Tax=Petrolisthes cinctipes TaxID=88211 RepID=A0AAE1KFS9_PETCI|nr:hypothetical protein Pcinc_022521 [Petrolisthes cinctipes]
MQGGVMDIQGGVLRVVVVMVVLGPVFTIASTIPSTISYTTNKFTTISPTIFPTTSPDDHNLGKLEDFIQNDPSSLCAYIGCQEPLSPSQCPEGTFYVEGVAQFGCCGSCVRFKRSVDPKFGGGYITTSTKSQGRRGHKKGSLVGSRSGVRESIVASSEMGLSRNVLQSSWCDFNLNCTETRTCEFDPMDRGCLYIQRQYDLALSDESYLSYRDDYRWRPVCDQDGQYAEKQCKGVAEEKRCICVDPYGNRIFGDAFPSNEEEYDNMNCKCSREVWERQIAGESSVTLHCAVNGNYEALQCEDDWCYCIDPLTATLIGLQLPKEAVSRLPCYNETLMGEKYLRRCESQLHAHWELFDVMANRGVQGNPTPFFSCSLDGSYAGKQCDQTMCRCYDKYMNFLTAPSGAGCQCARDKEYFKDQGIQKLVSCQVETGLYAEKQKSGGIVYCVDDEGVRSGPVVIMDVVIIVWLCRGRCPRGGEVSMAGSASMIAGVTISACPGGQGRG